MRQTRQKILELAGSELLKAQGYFNAYQTERAVDDLLNAQAHTLSALEMLIGYGLLPGGWLGQLRMTNRLLACVKIEIANLLR